LSPGASSRPGIAVTQTNGRDKREPAAGGAGRQEARDRHTEESHGDTADTHVRTRTHLHTRSSTSRCRATFPHPPPPNTHMANQLLRSGRRGQCTAHPRGSENAHASAHDHPPPQVPEWLLESDTTAHDFESTRRHSEVARARERANGTPDKHCSWRESGGGKREKKHKPSSSSSESGPSIPPMPPIIEDMSMPPIPVQHRHTQSFSAAPVLLPSKPPNGLPQPASYADSRAHVRKTSTPRPTSN